MLCPSCSHENREDATFCGGCGAALAAEWVCASCGRSNSPDQKFCDGCGHRLAETAKPAAAPDPRAYTPPHLAEKILRDRATLEGERRTVTALFADAIGFTPISERLDEEEVYDLMQGCLGRMMDAVHRYEGTITQFRGDGVMALFGAPIAHEDAACRAVECAADIQRAFAERNESAEEPIRVRIGLHTGEAIKEADDFYGKNVILAARIAGQVQGGEILVSSLLKELTVSGGDISFGEGREVELKGLAGQHRVFDIRWE